MERLNLERLKKLHEAAEGSMKAACLTFNVSHPVRMRVVPGEEGVVTQGTKPRTAFRKHLGKFCVEWHISLAASCLSCCHPGVLIVSYRHI